MISIAEYRIHSGDLKKLAKNLRIFDRVILSGPVYTARDAAHKRMAALIKENKPLPFDINGAAIYYAGPTGTPEGLAIGSCGPTTSGRMDIYSPTLLDMGLAAMIGKGERSKEVKDAIVKNGAVYLCAVGGAGALASRCITSCEVIAFDDLGCESIKKLYFKDFPLIVACDAAGGDIFTEGRKQNKKDILACGR